MDRSPAIRAIREAADLVALVQERVKLRKQGTGWMGGPCPIHGGGARTPCLSVLPDKGTWHCFGCGEGGDAFDWLQKVQDMTFEEALEDLSKRTGIALPQREKNEKQGPEDRILRALALAQDFYIQKLKTTPEAIAYLRGRGLTMETIEAEGLGFAPPGWDTTIGALTFTHGIRPEMLELAGIAARSERGTLIDFLRNRITIPITDARGRVIAFGGRAMGDAVPKYLNTRETPVFKKSDTVFHLHRARPHLRTEGALVVEGYFDVIALAQQGIAHAVAPMGTALTEAHLRTLKRWTSRVTLAFDGDPAGWSATEKAIHLALPAGFEVRLLHIPDGDDPDTWAMARGASAAEDVRSAPDWATFALDKAVEGKDLRRMEDRLAAAREVAQWIAYLPRERQDEIRVAAAHELKISPDQIKPAQRQESTPPTERRTAPRDERPALDEAVQAMIAMVAQGGPHLAWVEQVPRSWWEWRPGGWVLESLIDGSGDIQALPPAVRGAAREAQAKSATMASVDPRRLQLRLEREFLQREIQDMTRKAAASVGDDQMAAMLQAELQTLRARMARLTRGR